MKFWKVYRVARDADPQATANGTNEVKVYPGIILEDTHYYVCETDIPLVLSKEYKYSYDAVLRAYRLFSKEDREVLRLVEA